MATSRLMGRSAIVPPFPRIPMRTSWLRSTWPRSRPTTSWTRSPACERSAKSATFLDRDIGDGSPWAARNNRCSSWLVKKTAFCRGTLADSIPNVGSEGQAPSRCANRASARSPDSSWLRVDAARRPPSNAFRSKNDATSRPSGCRSVPSIAKKAVAMRRYELAVRVERVPRIADSNRERSTTTESYGPQRLRRECKSEA